MGAVDVDFVMGMSALLKEGNSIVGLTSVQCAHILPLALANFDPN